MPLRDELLSKRDSLTAAASRIQDALSHIDSLIESLDALSDQDGASNFYQETVTQITPRASLDLSIIAYMDEAKTFVAGWPKNLPFKISDFHQFLIKKFGAANVHDQSMRGPIPRLVKAGLIYVSRLGSGKSPHLYRVTSDLPPVIIGKIVSQFGRHGRPDEEPERKADDEPPDYE